MLSGLQAEATDEDGETAEEVLLGRGQEIVGPGDGIGHRAQSRRLVGRTTAEQGQLGGEPGQEIGRHQDAAASGGQLDGQGQPVYPLTDGGYGRGIAGREIEVT